jgi:hypothetical protein
MLGYYILPSLKENFVLKFLVVPVEEKCKEFIWYGLL